MKQALHFIKNFEPLWGNWFVESFLGEGSHSKVFLITKDELGFQYQSALKVFHITQKDSTKALKKEVLEEAQLLYSLRGNSHIVVYEDHQIIDLEDAPSFLILLRMEYLSSLTDFLHQNKTFTFHEFLNMAMDICSALEFCHNNHIIHRDIKPDNIFYKDHTFKLGDFSVSKKIDELHLTYTSVGTPVFSAPEVILNTPYDIRTDIYSLGLVLYKILNRNRLPFTPPAPLLIHPKDIRESIAKRLKGEPIPLPSFCVDQHNKLGEIILKACSFDPDNRFQNAKELKANFIELYKSMSSKELTLNLDLGYEPEAKPLIETEWMQTPLPNKTDKIHYGRAPLLGTELMKTDFSHTELIQEDFFHPDLNQVEKHIPPQDLPYGNLSNGNLMVNWRHCFIFSDVWSGFTLKKRDLEDTTLLLHDYCWHLTLMEDILFYTSGKHADSIYGLNLDTHENRLLVETASSHLAFHESHLYFINKDKNRNLYKTNLEEESPKLILDEYVREFVIYENTLFYTNMDGWIFSFHLLDKASKKCISDDSCGYLNPHLKTLYFVNKNNGNKITQISLDGNNKKVLGEFSAENLNVCQNRIYFSNRNDNFCLYSMDLKGKDPKKLWNAPSEYIHVLGNRVYFLQTSEPKNLCWVDCYKK
jgi:eukaryotic-like serine/threonine-protein kinase